MGISIIAQNDTYGRFLNRTDMPIYAKVLVILYVKTLFTVR